MGDIKVNIGKMACFSKPELEAMQLELLRALLVDLIGLSALVNYLGLTNRELEFRQA